MPRKGTKRPSPRSNRVGKGKPTRKPSRKTGLALPLTEANKLFIRAYMIRRNATRAYMKAYPEASYETANTEGSRLLRDPRVSSRIKVLLAQEAARLKVTYEKVTDVLAAAAFGNIADVFNDDGSIMMPTDMDRDVASAIKSMKRKEILAKVGEGGEVKVIGHTIEISMHDRVQPARLLGLELGMFKEKVEHSVDDDIVRAIREGRERALKGVV
jgi:phage terminase small subunit